MCRETGLKILNFRPLVLNFDYLTIKEVLNQCLPKLLSEKVKIPWTDLKKIPKSERKKFREQYTSKYMGPDFFQINIEERDGLVLGINDVTKALENEKAKSVLITEDIQPRLMVEHVIDQAVLLGIPVLVVPQLRDILKEKCGISSAAVAFNDSPRFKLVQDTISSISVKFPLPQNHINFNRVQKVTDDSVIIIEDSIIEDISKTNLMDTTDTPVAKPNNKTKKKSLEEGKLEHIQSVENVHLIRTSKDKRVFVPGTSSKEPKKDITDVDSSGFLSFSADTPCKETTVKNKYESLKVLKIKGDKDRNRRKIQALKERKSSRKSKPKVANKTSKR